MLGIFKGKEAKYNKLILKALVYGAKTTNQIAEFIYLNKKAQIKPKKTNLNEVKKIVSIISRKGSRLNELEAKHYIYREKGYWHLTDKGLAVALTLFNDLTEVYPYVRTDLTLKTIEKLFKKYGVSETLRKYGFNDWTSKIFSWARNRRNFLGFVRNSTNKLISQLIDLDSLSENEFQNLLIIHGIQNFFKIQLNEIEQTISEIILKENIKH
ncbi:MAG: hypothetical protein QXX51_03000 [Candidatus Bathyarchaeia archaeon]